VTDAMVKTNKKNVLQQSPSAAETRNNCSQKQACRSLKTNHEVEDEEEYQNRDEGDRHINDRKSSSFD